MIGQVTLTLKICWLTIVATKLLFLSLFLPAGFGYLTVILGLGVFYSLAFLKAKEFKSRTLVIASLILIFGYTALGQHDSRFFLEPYLWVLLAYNFRGVSFQSIYYLRSKIFRTAKFKHLEHF